MLDLLFSLSTLVYFTLTTTNYNTCFYLSILYNLLHLLCQLLILMPLLPLLPKLLHKNWLQTLRREHIKNKITSRYRMPIYCTAILMLSLACFYTIIQRVLVWDNYGYLFVVFCAVCCSLSEVSAYLRVRFDCSVFFAMEAYKFFCLVVATIMFGISAHEVKLSAQIMSMGWAYFVYRSKHSLPKQVIYYLILFMDVVILLTAIMVIGSSQNKSADPDIVKSKLQLMLSVSFFGVLFALEIYDFLKLYRSFARSGQFSDVDSKQNNIVQFYLNIQKFRRRKPQNPELQDDLDCSICLQKMKQKKFKGDRLILKCGHHYHSGCLEEWIYINHTCPLCRKTVIDLTEEELSI